MWRGKNFASALNSMETYLAPPHHTPAAFNGQMGCGQMDHIHKSVLRGIYCMYSRNEDRFGKWRSSPILCVL